MTSKSSFWGSLREHNRRRTWLWMLSWLFSILYYIAGCALLINSVRNYHNGLAQVQEITRESMQAALLDGVADFLGNSFVLCAAAAVIAVMAAIQGFSYLYQKKQVDFYHSLPVSKSRRFAVIWLGGLFIYLIPTLTGLLGGILVAASQGVMNGVVLEMLCIKMTVTLVLFFSLYNLTLVAVMLTGHIFITLCGTAVLHLYELLVRYLASAYQEQFFEKYVFGFGEQKKIWWTPAAIFLMKWDWENINWRFIDWNYFSEATVVLAVTGVLFLILSCLLFIRRPAEAAGRAMAFVHTKTVIKAGITIPVVLGTAIMIKAFTSAYNGGYTPVGRMGNLWFIILAVLVSAVVCCCVIEVIYEFDIKACLHKKRDILICGTAAALLLLGFRYDLFGFDAYVPRPEQVESYGMVLDAAESAYYNERGQSLSTAGYIWDNMFLTDAEAICRLAAIQPERTEIDEIMKVCYRLQSGRTVVREIWLDFDHPETEALLNRMVSTPEYRKGTWPILSEDFPWDTENPTDLAADWIMGPYTYRIPDEELANLVDAYRNDLELINYTSLSQSLPVGVIQLYDTKAYDQSILNNVSWYYNARGSSELIVYPECIRTIKLIQEMGLYMDRVYLVEDVERLEIINYNYSDAEMENLGNGPVGSGLYYDAQYNLMMGRASEADPDRTVSVSYSTPGEIQEVSQALYATGIAANGRRYEEQLDPSFSVRVYFKNGSNPHVHHMGMYSFNVLRDKMPYFIREATRYVEDTGAGVTVHW